MHFTLAARRNDAAGIASFATSVTRFNASPIDCSCTMTYIDDAFRIGLQTAQIPLRPPNLRADFGLTR
jgi:hypothetical protein